MTTSSIAGLAGSVKIGGTKIAEMKAFTLQTQAAMIDATSVDSNGWEESVQGRKSWTATSNCYFIDGDPIQISARNALVSGTLLSFEFHQKDSTGLKKWTGSGYISDWKDTFSENAAVMFDITIKGSGPLVEGVQ